MYTIKGRYTEALMTLDDFEPELVNQVNNIVNHPAFTNKIVVQPDGQKGATAMVGFSMELGEKIIPEVVSVDIGCSIVSANIGTELNMSLEELDKQIRKYVPLGFKGQETNIRPNKMEKFSFDKQFPWDKTNETLRNFTRAYNEKFNTSYNYPTIDYKWFLDKCKQIGVDAKTVQSQISSIGQGNHFISIDKSETYGSIWISAHTGSRQLGVKICKFHTAKSRKSLDYKRNVELRNQIEEIKKTADNSDIQNLIKQAKNNLGLDADVDLNGMEYLENQEAYDYLVDMVFCQFYAYFNRHQVVEIICAILDKKPIEIIDTTHNYVDFRDLIIRKGAVSSYIGEKMVIPLNMRDGILVCEGKSNPEWNFSAPHGAGRNHSRSHSRQNLDFETYKEQMKGIYSTSVCLQTLDECPDAYKSSSMIEAAIEPTATIIDRLKPLLNIKDKSSGPSWKEMRENKKNKKNNPQ